MTSTFSKPAAAAQDYKEMLMLRLAVSLVVGLLMVATVAEAEAQFRTRAIRNGVISPVAASRIGLKRAWYTQIELDRSRARLTHLRQHVSSNRFRTVQAVTWPNGKKYFTDDMVDRFGDPLGPDGAKELANKLIADLKNNDIQAELKEILVPEITLYGQTDQGTLHALDGQTGQTKWVVSVGNRNHPTLAPSANDHFVGVVNGSNVFVLEQETGKLIWQRQIGAAAGAGPALTDEHIYVPTVSGKMEVFTLDNYRKPAWYYQSTGRLLVQPTVSTNSISWATDRGYLYVGHQETRGVRFRLETREAIVTHATFLPPNKLFAVSIDGYAYCVHETNGDILWRFSAGDPISEAPVATHDAIYLVAEGAGLYSVSPETGLEQWWSPNITKVLSATKNRIYCMADFGRMVILDAKSGGRVDAVQAEGLDFLHANWQTDRIFVGTKTGVLQCLHETDADWPTVHNLPDPKKSTRSDVEQRQDGDKPDGPFDEPKDPFGEPKDPFGESKDPFGESKDPFGESPIGDGDEPTDPFGETTDPFGESGTGAETDDPPTSDPFESDPFGS